MSNRAVTTDLLPDLVDLGPAMTALPNERYRDFVRAFFTVRPGKGQNVAAARLAGFGTAASNPRTMSAIAARLMADERVAAAIVEVSKIYVSALGAAAVTSLGRMISDVNHKHHFRASAFIAERIVPAMVNHQVDVRHEFKPSLELTAAVLEKMDEIAARVGVRLDAPSIIDVTPKSEAVERAA